MDDLSNLDNTVVACSLPSCMDSYGPYEERQMSRTVGRSPSPLRIPAPPGGSSGSPLPLTHSISGERIGERTGGMDDTRGMFGSASGTRKSQTAKSSTTKRKSAKGKARAHGTTHRRPSAPQTSNPLARSSQSARRVVDKTVVSRPDFEEVCRSNRRLSLDLSKMRKDMQQLEAQAQQAQKY
ncbi:hypothetical protein KIPB_007669, partial [Kipferlia bialata]|eukprot:g7669.t1